MELIVRQDLVPDAVKICTKCGSIDKEECICPIPTVVPDLDFFKLMGCIITYTNKLEN